MVAFTTNIGLAKPTNSEAAVEWIEGNQYYSDNNVIVTAKVNTILTSYTPTINAQTTPPNIGAGAIRGEYLNQQGFITGNFVVEFVDPGVAGGTGEWGVSLPFVIDNSFHIVATAFNAAPAGSFTVIGEGYFFDNSNLNTSGSLALEATTVGGVSYARFIVENTPTKTSRYLTNNSPSTVGTVDKLTGQFFYKKA